MISKRALFLAGFAALSLNPVQAQAAITAGFLPPDGPQSAMTIDLPDDLDTLSLTMLGVELNGTDVTAMLQLNGTDFVYTPLTPLPAGAHTVRLYDFSSGAEIESWTFEITSASGANAQIGNAALEDAAMRFLRGGSVTIDSMTEFSDRSFDKHKGTAPKSSLISGGGTLDAEAQAGDGWRLGARADYLLQTDQDLALTGNVMDLAEYDISADYEGRYLSGGVTLGHHNTGLDSYLISDFTRRGGSVRLGDSGGHVQGTGFAFRPDSVTGARDFTGLQDDDRRLQGLAATIAPFATDADALRLTGIYYSGDGRDGGTGIAAGTNIKDGKGWGTIVEKGFGNQRLTLRGEFAHSRFEEGNALAQADDHASDAWSVGFGLTPFAESPVIGDNPLQLTVGGRYERIDTFFESLANPGLAADREAFAADSSLYWGGFSANLQLLYEFNNVDERADRATDRLRSAALGLGYSFAEQGGGLAWLGTPYVGFNATVGAVDRHETPAGLALLDTNHFSDSHTLSGGSSYDRGYWAASYSLSQFEDFANTASDTVNHYASLNGGWTVNDRLSLDSGLQFAVFRDEDLGDTSYDTIFNIGAQTVLLPDRLEWEFDYNLNLAGGDGDSPDRHIVNSEAEYTFFAPARNRPGLALAVRGQMEDSYGHNNATLDETNYQIYSVIRIKAPLAFDF